MVEDKPSVDEASGDSLRGNRPGLEVNSWASLLAGGVGAAVVGFATHALRTAGRPFAALDFIVNRCGALQYLVIGAALAGGAFLVQKNRQIARNRRVLDSGPVTPDHDPADDRALGDLREVLPKRPEFAWSILLNRLDRVLALWLATRDVARVAAWAKVDSARDRAASESSFSPARVLLWALPVLGFIGTINGMMAALFQFQEFGSAAGAVQLKAAIWQATTSVGLSFWCMLAALVLTVVLMIPLTAMQRREEQLLADFDAYVDDLLIARLPAVRTADAVPEELAAAIEAALRRLLPARGEAATEDAERLNRAIDDLHAAAARLRVLPGEGGHLTETGRAPGGHGQSR